MPMTGRLDDLEGEIAIDGMGAHEGDTRIITGA